MRVNILTESSRSTQRTYIFIIINHVAMIIVLYNRHIFDWSNVTRIKKEGKNGCQSTFGLIDGFFKFYLCAAGVLAKKQYQFWQSWWAYVEQFLLEGLRFLPSSSRLHRLAELRLESSTYSPYLSSEPMTGQCRMNVSLVVWSLSSSSLITARNVEKENVRQGN